jgi:hypothetical protein
VEEFATTAGNENSLTDFPGPCYKSASEREQRRFLPGYRSYGTDNDVLRPLS